MAKRKNLLRSIYKLKEAAEILECPYTDVLHLVESGGLPIFARVSLRKLFIGTKLPDRRRELIFNEQAQSYMKGRIKEDLTKEIDKRRYQQKMISPKTESSVDESNRSVNTMVTLVGDYDKRVLAIENSTIYPDDLYDLSIRAWDIQENEEFAYAKIQPNMLVGIGSEESKKWKTRRVRLFYLMSTTTSTYEQINDYISNMLEFESESTIENNYSKESILGSLFVDVNVNYDISVNDIYVKRTDLERMSYSDEGGSPSNEQLIDPNSLTAMEHACSPIWQKMAEQKWAENPSLSRLAAAEMIHSRLGGDKKKNKCALSVSTIRRNIFKPTQYADQAHENNLIKSSRLRKQ